MWYCTILVSYYLTVKHLRYLLGSKACKAILSNTLRVIHRILLVIAITNAVIVLAKDDAKIATRSKT